MSLLPSYRVDLCPCNFHPSIPLSLCLPLALYNSIFPYQRILPFITSPPILSTPLSPSSLPLYLFCNQLPPFSFPPSYFSLLALTCTCRPDSLAFSLQKWNPYFLDSMRRSSRVRFGKWTREKEGVVRKEWLREWDKSYREKEKKKSFHSFLSLFPLLSQQLWLVTVWDL